MYRLQRDVPIGMEKSYQRMALNYMRERSEDLAVCGDLEPLIEYGDALAAHGVRGLRIVDSELEKVREWR
jgi:tRNA G26 N,N-dimethylase Trm1